MNTANATKQLRTFIVTVKPRITTYAGSWADTGYNVQVSAFDRNEAIRMVRSRRTREEGRHGTTCDYSARLAQPSEIFEGFDL